MSGPILNTVSYSEMKNLPTTVFIQEFVHTFLEGMVYMLLFQNQIIVTDL